MPLFFGIRSWSCVATDYKRKRDRFFGGLFALYMESAGRLPGTFVIYTGAGTVPRLGSSTEVVLNRPSNHSELCAMVEPMTITRP